MVSSRAKRGAIVNDADLLAEWIDDIARDTRSEIEVLAPEVLNWQPDPDANSIGLTVWHYTRWLDLLSVRVFDNRAQHEEQWFMQGWAHRTGYDPTGHGLG